jgi:hypothetical protein
MAQSEKHGAVGTRVLVRLAAAPLALLPTCGIASASEARPDRVQPSPSKRTGPVHLPFVATRPRTWAPSPSGDVPRPVCRPALEKRC